MFNGESQACCQSLVMASWIASEWNYQILISISIVWELLLVCFFYVLWRVNLWLLFFLWVLHSVSLVFIIYIVSFAIDCFIFLIKLSQIIASYLSIMIKWYFPFCSIIVEEVSNMTGLVSQDLNYHVTSRFIQSFHLYSVLFLLESDS